MKWFCWTFLFVISTGSYAQSPVKYYISFDNADHHETEISRMDFTWCPVAGLNNRDLRHTGLELPGAPGAAVSLKWILSQPADFALNSATDL